MVVLIGVQRATNFKNVPILVTFFSKETMYLTVSQTWL